MRRFVTISAATLVAALVAIPGGMAQDVERWSAFGHSEPSTTYDTSEYMWQTPPTAAGQIYFNAFATYGNAGNGLANNIRFLGTGNAGVLETQNEVLLMETQVAIFGVWTDCNGDGYIGHAETGLLEYKSDLLLDDTACSPSTGSTQRWNGANNYNGWVTELIPISRNDPSVTPGNRDQRVFYDKNAMVWGDNGEPDQSLGGDGGTASDCALSPVPRGTWATTGGLFNYLDCNAAFIDFWNIAWQDERTVRGEPVPADTDPLDLGFEDEDDARGSTLDMELFGDDSADHSAVSVWDCGSPYLVRSGDALNMTPAGEATADNALLHNTAIYGLAPGTDNTDDPTVAGTYNATNEGLEGSDADPEGEDACDTSDDRGAEFYGLLQEGDVAADVSDGKTDAEWNFIYTTSNRGEAPWNVLGQASGNAGAPAYLGVYGLGFSGWDCFCVTFGNTPDVPFPRFSLGDFNATDPTTVPGAVLGADAGLDPAAPDWVSYYAYTSLDGTTAFSVILSTPGGLGSYGAVQCDGVNSGIQNGWNCDPETWYRNADGTVPNDIDLLAKVGSPYTHRDIDCMDGSTNAAVATQPAALGANRCIRVG